MTAQLYGVEPVERGCGRREQGGAYWEVPLGPGGGDLEDFILDPPLHLDVATLEGLGLQRDGRAVGVGVRLHEVVDPATAEPVTCLVDWVGEKHYACPADFLEEARRFGVSRRLSSTLDWKRLNANSRLLLVHPRAWIHNVADYLIRQDPGPIRPCPRHNNPTLHPAHVALFDRSRKGGQGELVRVPDGMCARLWWDDLPGGAPAPLPAIGDGSAPHPRWTSRTLPSFTYRGRVPPDGVKGAHAPAVFASFPLGRMVVVKGDGSEADTLERIRRANLPCDLVDE